MKLLRQRGIHEENEQLMKYKEELIVRICGMQKDIKILQTNSCALDGLATLAEAIRRI